jgi:hypothetical protein
MSENNDDSSTTTTSTNTLIKQQQQQPIQILTIQQVPQFLVMPEKNPKIQHLIKTQLV